MRTTLTIDDDLAALLERERQRTGESFRQVTNRLLRRGLQRGEQPTQPVELPTLPGRPLIDIVDTSAVLAAEDDDHLRDKGSF
jgi:hypothetical protein